MEIYSLGRTLHLTVGVVTLASFWIAGLARRVGRYTAGPARSTCGR